MSNVHDVVVDSNSNSSDQTDEKSHFINKLLVEMKSQFNKTDKKINAVVLDDEDMLNESVSNIEENNLDENSEGVIVKMEQEELVIKNECDVNTVDELKVEDVKEECENNEGQEEKPRIVLTFRKPASSTACTNKNKIKSNIDLNSSKKIVKKQSDCNEEKTEEIGLKRSARRRSKDCGESILQSAIARKEKSYNESNKPQRLTRQLKPTAKILENLKNAALEKNKTDKKKSPKFNDKQKHINIDFGNDMFSNTDDSTLHSESDYGETDKVHKKHKHKHHHNKHAKRNVKRLKSNYSETSRDSDSDQSSPNEVKESDSNSSPTESVKASRVQKSLEEKPYRRSQRISSSRYRFEETEMELEGSEMAETNVIDAAYPGDAECSSVGAQLIASRLCLCTQKTQLYITSDEDVTYCWGVDSINEKIVGCSNIVDPSEISMLRPSSRVPYIILCEVHRNRMLRHNCCPTCGIFCTQGRFSQCEAQHQYHRDCQISVGDMECCPHCGLSTPDYDVYITMHTSKKTVFLPRQNPSARMCLTSKLKSDSEESSSIINPKRVVSPPLIPPDALVFSVDLEGSRDNKYDIGIVFDTIREGNIKKLAEILGSQSVSLNVALEECDGGTILHYAAQNGLLAIVHMLVVAEIDLDSLDKEQNTPLMLAVLSMKNDVVQYLVKAGACMTLKGTDGMTALHLAAKCGNFKACCILLEASLLALKNYIDAPDDGGWTPLVWACEHGHADIAKFLMCKGADPLLRDVEHNIALHWASFSGSTHIVELLINCGSDVNALNAHGDTPLHIGARQDKYNCVLVLLARGANVALINKVGESALDCCLESGDCHSAISLNFHMQALVDGDRKSNRTILSNDISNGKENNPIQCVNAIDDEIEPTNYIYITKNCVTTDIPIDYKITSLRSCECDDRCGTESCQCANNSFRCWYDEEGKLFPEFDYSDPPMIFECNTSCSCNTITCNNRVVQRGLTQRFQLFRTDNRGWGIRTLRNIPKGTFVCEYVGEMLSDIEADQREDDSFLFDLGSRLYPEKNEKETFCIDAKHYGNLSRFINHSCDANLSPVGVFVEHQDLRFPRIALFAKRDIAADSELSFDYGEKFWIVKYKSFTCDCKSISCKYSDETILMTVENYNKRLQEDEEITP